MTKLLDSMMALQDAIGKERAKKIVDVDEEVFKAKLLPLAVARYSNTEYDVELTHWQNITGAAPTFGVNVMRNGEYLYTTPPLILSPRIEFNGESLLSRMNESSRNDQLGLAKMETMDSDVMKPEVEVIGLQSALMTWISIFQLYGIKLVVNDDSKDDSTDEPVAVQEPTPTQEMEFEDDEDGEIL